MVKNVIHINMISVWDVRPDPECIPDDQIWTINNLTGLVHTFLYTCAECPAESLAIIFYLKNNILAIILYFKNA